MCMTNNFSYQLLWLFLEKCTLLKRVMCVDVMCASDVESQQCYEQLLKVS